MRYVKDSAMTTHHNKLMRALPVELRRCLGGCDRWMRSTHSGHRICNECKGREDHGTAHWAEWRAGEPINTQEDV